MSSLGNPSPAASSQRLVHRLTVEVVVDRHGLHRREPLHPAAGRQSDDLRPGVERREDRPEGEWAREPGGCLGVAGCGVGKDRPCSRRSWSRPPQTSGVCGRSARTAPQRARPGRRPASVSRCSPGSGRPTRPTSTDARGSGSEWSTTTPPWRQSARSTPSAGTTREGCSATVHAQQLSGWGFFHPTRAGRRQADRARTPHGPSTPTASASPQPASTTRRSHAKADGAYLDRPLPSAG